MNDTSPKVVLLALLVAAAAPPTIAHHSVPVNFDQSREITIEGVLSGIATPRTASAPSCRP